MQQMPVQGSDRRLWKIRGSADPARESLSEEILAEKVQVLQEETGLSPVTLRVCILRGLDSMEAIQEFLSPRFDQLKSPFSIKGMDLAVDRVMQAKTRGERIRVFGDYDVDGTTGAALLSWVFREMGFQFEARQPDRFKDGYGLNPGAVEEAVRDGATVLVTVDCGITSFVAAEKAKALGIDLIVLDHHQLDPVKGLPLAYSVVNPQRPDCESGLKQLCGCGLAFYFSLALRSKARELGWFATQPEPNLKQHLDLVVMATAADMVPLVGDNHILVKYGLEVLKHSKKPGVKALLDAAGLGSKDLSPSHLGFVLGPRINASGRMDSASIALELLTTQDPLRAHELAQTIERLNRERAELQNQIWDQVRIKIEKGIEQGKYRHGILVADSSWHEGVVGIVASRVTETFRKPAAVVALRHDIGKGSVRSFGGKDVLQGLRQCSEFLVGFGGHKHAAGLSAKLDQIDALAERFDDAMAQIPTDSQGGSLYIEGPCSIQDLDLKALQELERLGPFGPGNPEPVFSVRAVVKSHRILKGRHLKMNLSSVGSSRYLDAIWFHGAEREEVLGQVLSPEEQEWAGVPELNRFRGQVTPTFRVRDWRRIGVSSNEK